MPPLKNDTPQRRRKIEQLVHNALPADAVVFVPADSGSIAFRVRAKNGRYRTRVITIHHGRIKLNRAWLERELAFNAART